MKNQSNYIVAAMRRRLFSKSRERHPLGWQHLTIVDCIRYLTTSNLHHSGDIPRDAVFSQRVPLALENRWTASHTVAVAG
jgi:hypothetical protein